MRLLLDTNVLIWWLRDDPKLGVRARHLIADEGIETLVSMISLWEITLKWRVGKMDFTGYSFLEALERERITPLGIKSAHLQALEHLPYHHRDPYDHLILAQAKVEGATIITSDRQMADYGVPCISAA
jgi:PIN domain nuclease of toxin-antitoxin system